MRQEREENAGTVFLSRKRIWDILVILKPRDCFRWEHSYVICSNRQEGTVYSFPFITAAEVSLFFQKPAIPFALDPIPSHALSDFPFVQVEYPLTEMLGTEVPSQISAFFRFWNICNT